MSVSSRREFLEECRSAMPRPSAFLPLARMELRANPLGLPIGCQTWPVRSMIAKDFPGHDQTARRCRISDH